LQGAFETFYSFEIDELKKQNLGAAVQQFQGLPGMTPFVLAYLIQQGLGGHAIPVDTGAMRLMYACEIVNESERDAGKVPGLERAIPKNKGIEFGSLLHQASVALMEDQDNKAVVAVIKAVDKQGIQRLHEATDARRATAIARQREATAKEPVEPVEPASEPSKKAGKSEPASGKPAKKKSAGKKSEKKVAANKEAPKKTAATNSPKKKKKAKSTKSNAASKSPSKRLAKRKPR